MGACLLRKKIVKEKIIELARLHGYYNITRIKSSTWKRLEKILIREITNELMLHELTDKNF